MKKPINFRLKNSIVDVLENLSRDLKMSKTQVVEIALIDYARKNKVEEHPLAKFSGVLKDESKELDSMLAKIKESKTSKDISVTL